MKFRTELIIKPDPNKINHKTGTATIGSCFADVIGSKLQNHKFNVLVNPFGTIFNPLSLGLLLRASLNQQSLPDNSYINTRGAWFNYHLHSSIFSLSKEDLKEKVEYLLSSVKETLQKTERLIITLGTAYVYKLTETGTTVANCHKMPAACFNKTLITPEEITKDLNETFSLLKKAIPELEVILSVSPVRHIKDTIPLNSVSKSVLRLAAHQISENLNYVTYFPAFELLMDDLRDYRFYQEDLVHPTAQAELYIWEKFTEVYFSEETTQINREWQSIKRALEHKPFQPESEEHRNFLKETLKRLEKLSDTLSLEKEIKNLKDRLA